MIAAASAFLPSVCDGYAEGFQARARSGPVTE